MSDCFCEIAMFEWKRILKSDIIPNSLNEHIWFATEKTFIGTTQDLFLSVDLVALRFPSSVFSCWTVVVFCCVFFLSFICVTFSCF